ncbi:ATP-binding protein [Candidatus Bipolaricaulota bacterium]|nr:ATP-binding protein [Candidatus Bipolaricaulota bacterium]
MASKRKVAKAGSKAAAVAKGVRPGIVVILKGSPGVGKSYVARKLIARLPSRKRALIAVDELLHVDQRPLSRDKLRLAKFHAAIMTRSFLREGFDVVIEYTFDLTEDLEFLLEKISRSHAEPLHPSKVFVVHLSAPFDKVVQRNANRRDGSDPMKASLLKKLHGVCEATAGKVDGELVIDTGKLGVHRILDTITAQWGPG